MYPLVIAPNGRSIMRINYDASISVRWDKILDERYKIVDDSNLIIVKFCEVLLAARDNFVAVPWDESTSWKDRWEHYSLEIDYLDKPIPKTATPLTIMSTFEPIAIICRANHWHIWWSEVEDVARLPPDEAIMSLIGMCRLLVAAKDRFRTKPWNVQCDIE